jgi:hypothetical protein
LPLVSVLRSYSQGHAQGSEMTGILIPTRRQRRPSSLLIYTEDILRLSAYVPPVVVVSDVDHETRMLTGMRRTIIFSRVLAMTRCS